VLAIGVGVLASTPETALAAPVHGPYSSLAGCLGAMAGYRASGHIGALEEAQCVNWDGFIYLLH
jgi:hypothetical protein